LLLSFLLLKDSHLSLVSRLFSVRSLNMNLLLVFIKSFPLFGHPLW
jgi:hypothetical protein